MHLAIKSLFVSLLGASVLASPLPSDALVERNAPLNEFLSTLLSHLPAIDGTIDAVSGVITDFDQLLADLTGARTTQNGYIGVCTDYTVLFARGTSEPGNVGVLVGPPLSEAFEEAVGARALSFQGVNGYNADVAGYLAGGDAAGSKSMASLASEVLSKCPDTKLVMSGYSQGCQIVHNAVEQLPAEHASKISSVLLFGDPYAGKAFPHVDASRVHTVCHAGDTICNNSVIILPPHLTYAVDVTNAAHFAVAAANN
ncbi:Cutinase [Aspergillus parasiticus SU-1]|uniref:Cutinase n=4 Tax=Aspergillus subgen. Circumdati TaxID=2720871 RepID=A0A5N6E2P0_ASPPA|nr:cutinase-domain-containing protein [Aspergillus parasiticus]KAB8220196.1 cutinase-domain-containing protein [Aspergillus novoparasiticus]KAE8310281.1 cutinase-domain-containing protein [Aspergillus transmontanensis]KJK65682.1 Cutinase [Aspergillus parasiticus SU-1]